MNTTLRIKFERTGPVRYIGHLDMMRYFQKAVMRAGIDIRYSEGFNPHQIMSFAYPLGVSMETKGDYLDIDVLSYQDCRTVTDRLNTVMAEGIRVISTTALPEGAKNAMASVAAADYLVHIRYGEPDLSGQDDKNCGRSGEREPADGETKPSGQDGEASGGKEKPYVQEDKMSGGMEDCRGLTDDMLRRFLARGEIIVLKETGKKTSRTDIRPGILALELREDEMLFMKLRSGSEGNIKPSAVLETLSDMFGMKITSDRIVRLEIYAKGGDGTLIPLG